MSLQLNNPTVERRVDKTINSLKAKSIVVNKQEFLVTAINFYIDDLVKKKVIQN